MSDPELLTESARSLRVIHVITGWNIPEDEEYMKILLEQFSLKMQESFPNLNFKEIQAAFRKNGIGVKDWGKNMNLDLICSVLGQYSAERSDASAIEEQVTYEPVQRLYSDEEMDNESRELTEVFYQRIRRGVLLPVPDFARSILVKDGFIEKPDQADQFFVDRLNKGSRGIYEKAES